MKDRFGMEAYAFYKALRYLIAGGGLLKITALGTLYYVVNGLGPEGFGKYTLAIAAISLSGVGYRLVSGQIYQIELARLLGRGKAAEAQGLKKQALLLITGVTVFLGILLGCLLFVVFHTNIFKVQAPEYAPYIGIGALYLFTYGYKSVFVSTNRGYGYFKEQTQWDLVEAVLRFTLVLLFIKLYSRHLTVSHILFIDWAALLVGWITYRFLFQKNSSSKSYKHISSSGSILLRVIREHGAWFFLRLVAVDLTANIRLWIIGSLISVEAVGIFGAAKRIVQSGKILLPFGVLLNSFLSRDSSDKNLLRASYIQGLRISMLLSIAVIILLFIVTLTIIPYAFYDMGKELQYVIFILSGIYIFKAGTYSVNSMLGIDRKYRTTFYVAVISFVGMLVFLPLLIHYFGLFGAVIEAVVGSALAFLIAYYLLVKNRPDFAISYNDLKVAITLKNITQLKQLLRG